MTGTGSSVRLADEDMPVAARARHQAAAVAALFAYRPLTLVVAVVAGHRWMEEAGGWVRVATQTNWVADPSNLPGTSHRMHMLLAADRRGRKGVVMMRVAAGVVTWG